MLFISSKLDTVLTNATTGRIIIAIQNGFKSRLIAMGLQTCLDNHGSITIEPNGMRGYCFNSIGEQVLTICSARLVFRLTKSLGDQENDSRWGFAFERNEATISYDFFYLPENDVITIGTRTVDETAALAFGTHVAEKLARSRMESIQIPVNI